MFYDRDDDDAGVWLDPPNPRPHYCSAYRPEITRQDLGRRWRCTCKKVWRVIDMTEPNAPTQVGWTEEPPPLELVEYDDFTDLGCKAAPAGWWCSRPRDHDGPCAARPQFWSHPILWFKHL